MRLADAFGEVSPYGDSSDGFAMLRLARRSYFRWRLWQDPVVS
jgi:hypothetical protein